MAQISMKNAVQLDGVEIEGKLSEDKTDYILTVKDGIIPWGNYSLKVKNVATNILGNSLTKDYAVEFTVTDDGENLILEIKDNIINLNVIKDKHIIESYSLKKDGNLKRYIEPKLDSLNRIYIYGKNDLFALIIIMKQMLSHDEFSNMIEEIRHNFENLSMNLHTIKLDKVLDRMGFPINYYDIKNLD